MNRFSIRDVENLTGVKAHTIRIWEQRYNIFLPKRTDTNIRYYDAADIKHALRITMLNSYGFKISRICKMSEPEISLAIQKITDESFKMQLIVNELLEATLATDMDAFEMLLNMYLKKHGIERTVEELIFTFLEKVGLMWMSDKILPAQEHLVSNVIYRKLAVAVDAVSHHLPPAPSSFLLFLPEGEVHELALMYVNYLLHSHRRKVTYLGANAPLSEVGFVYDMQRPKYIYTHLTSVSGEFDGNDYLEKLSARFPDSTILVSGRMLRGKKYKAFGNITYLHSLQQVRDAITAIAD